ncbi:metal-dependent hydrolase [Halorientalis marina]|jgi:hypothetical protein|uniref:metal-dependent hydrolase n=1 Tax=Halorientalis marina TaxID=2931976 RepID=UPI001FF2C4B2|nr:metal-dependent hydrolase [Halorientalis marina]
MNKDGHVLNAVLLSIGLGYILEPAGDLTTFRTIAEVIIPVTLGALFPDVDSAFGKHRKTFHNFLVLGVFLAYPYFFGNLQFVWIGVATHFVLDLMGTKRGLALLYPWEKEFDLPFGVPVSSSYSNLVMLIITALELAVIAVVLLYLPEYVPAGLLERGTAAVGNGTVAFGS